MKKLLTFAATLALCAATSAADAQVSYTATDISGSTWQYDYTITNTVVPANVGEFTVFFPLGQYSSLSVAASPSSWNSIVAQPDPGLPADGFFDSQALSSGLAPGNRQSGFAVDFTWLGSGKPGAQTYDFVNPSNYSTLYQGSTAPASSSGGSTTAPAPEIDPGSSVGAVLLLFGSLAILRGRRT